MYFGSILVHFCLVHVIFGLLYSNLVKYPQNVYNYKIPKNIVCKYMGEHILPFFYIVLGVYDLIKIIIKWGVFCWITLYNGEKCCKCSKRAKNCQERAKNGQKRGGELFYKHKALTSVVPLLGWSWIFATSRSQFLTRLASCASRVSRPPARSPQRLPPVGALC